MPIVPFLGLLLLAAAGPAAPEPHQATGVKVGEVTPTSALIWVRLTADATRRVDGLDLTGRRGRVLGPEEQDISALRGSAPGASGRVQVRYGVEGGELAATPWVEVDGADDYSHTFALTGLQPDTLYRFETATTGPGGTPVHGALTGHFRTAPPRDRRAPVSFTVITGQMYADLDDPAGYLSYEAMLKQRPAFLIPTGDTVYYDNEDPRATTVPVARYHWDRMYSLARLIAFGLEVPGFWMKDDHDTYADDCWPGQHRALMDPFTFAEGQRIYRQEVPLGEQTWRTVRWGKLLEVWLVEGRDFRSPNNAPDGPGKSIWGEAQKRWLQQGLLASDAEWKILASPTPIVGPDRAAKGDNHANAAFATEGREFRAWAARNLPERFSIVCGDRHWQYHSVDPESGVQEFCSGPASDQHAGGSPGDDPAYHRFHRVKGGYLSVTVEPRGAGSAITFRHHDVAGQVVHEYTAGS